MMLNSRIVLRVQQDDEPASFFAPLIVSLHGASRSRGPSSRYPHLSVGQHNMVDAGNYFNSKSRPVDPLQQNPAPQRLFPAARRSNSTIMDYNATSPEAEYPEGFAGSSQTGQLLEHFFHIAVGGKGQQSSHKHKFQVLAS